MVICHALHPTLLLQYHSVSLMVTIIDECPMLLMYSRLILFVQFGVIEAVLSSWIMNTFSFIS